MCYTPIRMTVRHARGPTEREVVTSLVRRVRAARAWRQADLARALGVSQSYVARLEAGARTSPSLRLWRRLQALAGEGEGRATA
jgi:predicted transcriptional regulator